MGLWRLTAALVLALGAGQAQQTADALYQAALKGDSSALQQLRTRAQQGDPDAEVDLGLMYYQGDGVAKDIATAAGWWRKAADQGNAAAELQLGLL